ncbi:MAG TPA: monovalent cation/H+ antiporter complex subunit F [Euzebyales bacterium]
MTYLLGLCLTILLAAGGLALARVIRRGASVAERIVALDLLLLIGVMGIAVYSVLRDTGVFLDVLVVVSLVGFVSTITVARFIERRGI